MATYGFLDVLEEELEKNFPFDFEISWDKRNHAVEVSFLLEAQNAAGVEMVARTERFHQTISSLKKQCFFTILLSQPSMQKTI